MGMLMHQTWLNQQKEKKPVKVTEKPAEKAVEEPVSEPVKRSPGRRKTTK